MMVKSMKKMKINQMKKKKMKMMKMTMMMMMKIVFESKIVRTTTWQHQKLPTAASI